MPPAQASPQPDRKRASTLFTSLAAGVPRLPRNQQSVFRTVQWGGWNTGTQYGPDYSYYGSRSGSRYSRSRNLGERSNTGTQYGPDYGQRRY
jgi:hypothetical protein